MRWFPPVWKMLIHFVQHSVLMSGDLFAETTKAYFGDVTFAEAFVISKRAVSIQVSVVGLYKLKSVDLRACLYSLKAPGFTSWTYIK